MPANRQADAGNSEFGSRNSEKLENEEEAPLKAVLCKAFGPPETLVIEEVPSPVPGPGQIVIAVKAASVNFPDTLIIENKYQYKPPLPFSPGSECAGLVKKVGEGVTHLREGDRVMAVTTYGSFAEEVLTHESRALAIPAGMDFPTAAAFTLTYGTSAHALIDRGELQAGETLLVLGASGGVGLAAIEIGKAMGANVIACASTDDKLAVCRAHGADETINYTTEDLRERLKTITKGNGVDVVYDPVGGPHSEMALRSTAWRGRFLVVGFAAGEIPRIPLNLVLLKGCSVVGVFWGEFMKREPERFAEVIKQLGVWFQNDKLKPYVSERLPLERAAEALRLMSSRQVKGKLVLTV
jgi:NADPH:quinone reductase